MVARNDT